MNRIVRIFEEAALFFGQRVLDNLLYSTWTSLAVTIRKSFGVASPATNERTQELKMETPFRSFPMISALRTDQMTITEVNTREFLGLEYTNLILPEFIESSKEITFKTPVCFVLSPEADTSHDVEARDSIKICFKDAEFQKIVFSLRCFYASIQKMSKVEVEGWNKSYSFNVVDLTISLNTLYNYLEATDKTTWNDLKRLFGGFKYAITNDCGITLCRTYPEVYVNTNLLERDILFAPLSDGYNILYDHHSNAQIVTPTRSKNVFQTQLEIKPRNHDTYFISKNEKVRQVLDGILVTIPEPFNVMDMMIKIEKLTPHLAVALRECFRMNGLMNEIRKSLKDLNLGLKGGMSKTPDMEALEECLLSDKVPPRWEERDYPSLLPLPAWHQYLLRRVRELESRVLKYKDVLTYAEIKSPKKSKKRKQKTDNKCSEYNISESMDGDKKTYGGKGHVCEDSENNFEFFDERSDIASKYHTTDHTNLFFGQFCCKKFNDSKNVFKHENSHTGKTRHECNVCFKTFTRKDHLCRHERTHTGEKAYVCNVCGRSFSKKSTLVVHNRTHTGERPYECNVCGRSFSQQPHLVVYNRTHTGDRPYECNVCGRSFSQQPHLVVHNTTHTGERPYECGFCEKKFTASNARTRHTRNVHYKCL